MAHNPLSPLLFRGNKLTNTVLEDTDMGWLTQNAIRQSDGTWKIKSDSDPLLPEWQFPNYSGMVQLATSLGSLLATAEALTVDAALESITPTWKVDPILVVAVSGAGGLADDLKQITVSAAFIGKLIVLKGAGAGDITVKNGAPMKTGSDFILNSVYDLGIYEVIAANTVLEWTRKSNA